MIATTVLIATSIAFPVSQQTPVERIVPDSSGVYTEVARISAGAMSPFCPGLTVANCPSPQAALLQDSIKNLVVAGWSSAAIEAWLVDEFGEQVRGRPSWRGLDLLGWTLPYVALVCGALVLAWVLLPRRARAGNPVGPDVSPQVNSLIEQEMNKLSL